MKDMGMDIGKRRCDVCVVGKGGRVLERRHYLNMSKGAKETAGYMAHKYAGCQAACETTGNIHLPKCL